MKSTASVQAGDVFARLTVLEKIVVPGIGTGFRCRCECGTERVCNARNLIGGNTRSCGCYHRETHTTHGLTRSRVYGIWKSMIQRCENPNAGSFENYGGRGIAVSASWRTFENFLADMGHPEPKFTLERVDNDRGYSKENCRWATYTDQLNNRRNNRVITAFGRTQTLTQWARETGLAVTTLKNRLARGGWSPEMALSSKPQTGYMFSPTKHEDAIAPQSARWKKERPNANVDYEAIRQMRQRGATFKAVGAAFGLTAGYIWQICQQKSA